CVLLRSAWFAYW
nr:immunoglobulin heavy chain junction region [Mus musculus]MBK4195256.1 immunoglobulin heavy chain junction region [Mus musculus]